MKLDLGNRIARLAGEPLVQFFVIAALIYTAYAFVGAGTVEDDGKHITVTAGEIAALEDSWKKRWNRPPTQKELQGILKQFLREHVLSVEAKAMGLDKEDVVIRRRLMQKLEYLSQDLLGGGTPSDEQLAAFFAKNAKAYEVPAVVTLTHIFFDPDQRGGQALEEATNQKVVLAKLKVAPTDARSYGDQFLLQSYYPERTYAELSKLFGSGFVETLPKLSPKQWHGPVLSGYGVHLVYIHHREEAHPAKQADVKDRVLAHWKDERRKELSEKYLIGLLERYQVSIESENPTLKTLEQTGAET
jgi:peptidyl-prolyl cis-trans isomerase C